MITTSALTRRFGATTALTGITLQVPRGEMFALIGPDGAGKTTFFRLVAGVLTPTSGAVTRETGTFGLVPQRFGLYQDLSIDENMRLRSDLYSVPRDFIRNCRTPILVLPDDTPSHPLPTSIDVASLAPNAEITVFPWREPPELKARTINRVRTFLKPHVPMRSAAQ